MTPEESSKPGAVPSEPLDLAVASTSSVVDMSERATPTIDRTIYTMPMFATFQVADITAAETFYQATGFVTLATISGSNGSPVLVHLRRMKYQDLLLISGESQRGVTTISFAAGGQDLQGLADRLRSESIEGARIDGPTDTAWFTTDLSIEDPDGHRVIFTAPRKAERGRAREWTHQNIEGDFIVEK